MRNIMQFIQYHNAVPIALSIVLLGAGGAFAASNPDAVYSESQKVVAVDNTYLVSKDLTTYSPRTVITSVLEDNENYFVSYTVQTIDLDAYAWKDIQRNETMQVSKAELGAYRDLGTYVTEKMSNIIDRELMRLRETQATERSHVSQMVVATEYGGIIGKFLDSSTEQIPGYTPIVQPEPHQEFVEVSPPSMEQPSVNVSQAGAAGAAVPAPSATTNEPKLSLLGNNPAEVPLGATYSDLGAIITSTPNNYAIHVYFEGSEVQQVSLDTSKAGEYDITYRAWNEKGETGEAVRHVRVIDPNAPAAATEPSAEVTTTPSPVPPAEQTPPPSPTE